MNQRLNALLTYLGMTMLVISITTTWTPAVLAGTQSFTENWQATQYYEMLFTQAGANHYFCMGPSEWKISGTSGSTSYSETWTLQSVLTSAGYSTDGYPYQAGIRWDFAGRRVDQGTCSSDNYVNPTAPYSSNTLLDSHFGIFPMGEYGAVVNAFYGGAFDARGRNLFMFFSATPSQWTINGTVTTP